MLRFPLCLRAVNREFAAPCSENVGICYVSTVDVMRFGVSSGGYSGQTCGQQFPCATDLGGWISAVSCFQDSAHREQGKHGGFHFGFDRVMQGINRFCYLAGDCRVHIVDSFVSLANHCILRVGINLPLAGTIGHRCAVGSPFWFRGSAGASGGAGGNASGRQARASDDGANGVGS